MLSIVKLQILRIGNDDSGQSTFPEHNAPQINNQETEKQNLDPLKPSNHEAGFNPQNINNMTPTDPSASPNFSDQNNEGAPIPQPNKNSGWLSGEPSQHPAPAQPPASAEEPEKTVSEVKVDEHSVQPAPSGGTPTDQSNNNTEWLSGEPSKPPSPEVQSMVAADSDSNGPTQQLQSASPEQSQTFNKEDPLKAVNQIGREVSQQNPQHTPPQSPYPDSNSSVQSSEEIKSAEIVGKPVLTDLINSMLELEKINNQDGFNQGKSAALAKIESMNKEDLMVGDVKEVINKIYTKTIEAKAFEYGQNMTPALANLLNYAAAGYEEILKHAQNKGFDLKVLGATNQNISHKIHEQAPVQAVDPNASGLAGKSPQDTQQTPNPTQHSTQYGFMPPPAQPASPIPQPETYGALPGEQSSLTQQNTSTMQNTVQALQAPESVTNTAQHSTINNVPQSEIKVDNPEMRSASGAETLDYGDNNSSPDPYLGDEKISQNLGLEESKQKSNLIDRLKNFAGLGNSHSDKVRQNEQGNNNGPSF